jgi:hypothetical protein
MVFFIILITEDEEQKSEKISISSVKIRKNI